MSFTIVESGMTFGPFLEEHCFYIEKSNAYNKLQSGVKMAEFFLIQPDKNMLLVVEAKSSSPNPTNKESEHQFRDFIIEIAEKLSNALTFGLALSLERHADHKDEISRSFKDVAYDSVEIVLLLVINGYKKEWLVPLNEALQKKLKSTCKIWPLKVVAINEKIAQKYNLIQQTMA
jgi:hypothetical protein